MKIIIKQKKFSKNILIYYFYFILLLPFSSCFMDSEIKFQSENSLLAKNEILSNNDTYNNYDYSHDNIALHKGENNKKISFIEEQALVYKSENNNETGGNSSNNLGISKKVKKNRNKDYDPSKMFQQESNSLKSAVKYYETVQVYDITKKNKIEHLQNSLNFPKFSQRESDNTVTIVPKPSKSYTLAAESIIPKIISKHNTSIISNKTPVVSTARKKNINFL